MLVVVDAAECGRGLNQKGEAWKGQRRAGQVTKSRSPTKGGPDDTYSVRRHRRLRARDVRARQMTGLRDDVMAEDGAGCFPPLEPGREALGCRLRSK